MIKSPPNTIHTYINQIASLSLEVRLFVVHFPKHVSRFFNRNNLLKKKQMYRQQIINDRDAIINVLPDTAGVLEYIKEHDVMSIFNDDFESKYTALPVNVYYDRRLKFKYIESGGKKLYYPAKHSNRTIATLYRYICSEQDRVSPHRYLDDDEDLKDTVLFDCGCAEGSLTFDHLDELKHAYLFEGDPAWIGPLNATFSSWEKVTVIERFLGSGEGHLSLREYIEGLIKDGRLDGEKDNVFIKMDVEGAEPALMKDIAPILHRIRNVRLAVCVYHRIDDEQKVIETIPYGYTHRIRRGYMLFYDYDGKPVFPYFKHGILRIEKYSNTCE